MGAAGRGWAASPQPRLTDLTHRALGELQPEFRRPGLLVLDKPLPRHSVTRENGAHARPDATITAANTGTTPRPDSQERKCTRNTRGACAWMSQKPGEGFEWSGTGSFSVDSFSE